MALCKWCGRSGRFLSVNQEGLCKRCSSVVGYEISEKVRSLNELLKIFLGDEELKAALSHCDLIINQASFLTKFEAKGIVTLTTPPSVVVQQYQDLKEKLPREWFKAELESTLAEAAATKNSNSKMALLSLFLRKLQRYRSQACDPGGLEDLEKQASEALRAIRQKVYENGADPWQPPNTENPSETRKDFSTERPPISTDERSEAPKITATTQDENCPYCRQPLRKIPKRKALCPHCKKPIYVRPKQEIFPGASLFTERDARAIAWLAQLGVSRHGFELQRGILSKQFGKMAEPSDVVWTIMNRSLTHTRDKSELQATYLRMAEFLYQEGRDHLRLRQEAQKLALSDWQEKAEQGLIDWSRTRLQVITCGGASCEECEKLTGVEFTIEEVLSQMPLPVKNCTHEPVKPSTRGWCRCCYGLSFTRD